MKKLLPLLFLLKITLAFGQDFKESIRLDEIHHLAPKGYAVLDTASGDLNKDAFIDLIVLYKKVDEEETSDVTNNPEERPLVLYIGDGSGAFKRVAQNENVAYCFDCGGMMGDPYQGIAIKNGYFTVEHYGGSGWRWTMYITFKYSEQSRSWNLHKDGGESFHAAEPEVVTTKIRTVKEFGIIPFAQYNIYKEEE